ncbi:MAG: ASKHA domain-containing protein, partial [Candidatus Sumerlaeota bacterium]|nr:ASKHA domain-containing protein [Candidatus Sumerlaeota bacterium]
AHQPPPVRAAEAGLAIHPRGLLYCLPSVGAFVGADMTAGVMAAGLDESDAVRMLIDIGTNGEIVIGNRDWLVCASASAGPAFEGAGNKDGMRATRGAIDHVHRTEGGTLEYSTVGARPPAGLCGTAYVDLLAELLRIGVIDKTGKFHREAASDRVRPGAEGTPEFVVVRSGENGAKTDVAITQDDVANLLRSKAAMYAAAKVLLRAIGLKFSDIAEFLVAGAFGSRLDLGNAVAIGLLPDVSTEKLRFVGNTSILGAKMAALNEESYDRARRIAGKMTYFELSAEPTFMDEFTSACFFPHTHVEEFPSVCRPALPRRA